MSVNFKPVDFQKGSVLLGKEIQCGRFKNFKVAGRSKDGSVFASRSLRFRRITPIMKNERWLIRLAGRCTQARLRIKAQDKINKPKIRYLVKGFRCEDVVDVPRPFGLLRMSGRAEIRDYNEVTGEFCIFALHQDVGAVQSELDLRSLCDHIRLICSLGEGTFLRAPIIEIYKPEHLNIICFETARTFPPEWPIIHYRLMEGFINVAVRSFGNLDIKKLPYAIEWILMPTTYNEIRMLNRIIALESLVFRNLSNEEKLDSDVAELGKIVREHVHGRREVGLSQS